MKGAGLLVLALLSLSLTACRGSTAATVTETSVPTTPAVVASATEGRPDPTRTPATTVSARSITPTATTALPVGCDEAAIVAVVRAFVAAFNAGDQATLARLFPTRGTDGDHPWTGDPEQLRWFSLVRANPSQGVDLLNLTTPETLLAYFAARHAQHERIAIVQLVVNRGASGPGLAAINFRIARAADDLSETPFPGKGGVDCASGKIFLWSQGGVPLAQTVTPTRPR